MRLIFLMTDCGAKIGVGVQIGDRRRAWRFRNPLWPVINWRWHRTHPGSLPCATPKCRYCVMGQRRSRLLSIIKRGAA